MSYKTLARKKNHNFFALSAARDRVNASPGGALRSIVKRKITEAAGESLIDFNFVASLRGGVWRDQSRRGPEGPGVGRGGGPIGRGHDDGGLGAEAVADEEAID